MKVKAEADHKGGVGWRLYDENGQQVGVLLADEGHAAAIVRQINGAATDNGGPAFPADSFAAQHCPGMNLRQWYAGQALASVAASIMKGGADSNARPAEVTRTIASVCIELADALIAAERAKVSP